MCCNPFGGGSIDSKINKNCIIWWNYLFMVIFVYEINKSKITPWVHCWSLVANLHQYKIFRLHGFPKVLISYRDSKFNFVFWKSLHKVLGTKLNMSSSYHPEIDGQIEHVNKVLEDMHRMYCMEQKTKWKDYIYLVEFTYNNGYHSSL